MEDRVRNHRPGRRVQHRTRQRSNRHGSCLPDREKPDPPNGSIGMTQDTTGDGTGDTTGGITEDTTGDTTGDMTGDATGEIDGTDPRRPVIVGYDGSDGAKRAVLWASRYAVAAQLPLVVVHCWTWPFFTRDLGPVQGVQDSGLRREAERLMAEGQALATRAEPDLLVRTRLVVGFPSEALVRLSAEASLLVTGTRGLGGFAELLIGSVSLHLAASASCPVMVVRDARPTHGTVVVAVDGSPASDRAAATAADVARTLHKRLQLLHVNVQRRRKQAGALPEGRDPVLERAATLLAGTTDLTITEDSAASSSAAGFIVQRTSDASCVFLGARGSHSTPTRLGSTIHAVLHHAKGNVGVVP